MHGWEGGHRVGPTNLDTEYVWKVIEDAQLGIPPAFDTALVPPQIY